MGSINYKEIVIRIILIFFVVLVIILGKNYLFDKNSGDTEVEDTKQVNEEVIDEKYIVEGYFAEDSVEDFVEDAKVLENKYSGVVTGVQRYASFMIIQLNVGVDDVKHVEINLDTVIFDSDTLLVVNPMDLNIGHKVIVYKSNKEDDSNIFKTRGLIIGSKGNIIEVSSIKESSIEGVIGVEDIVKLNFTDETEVINGLTGYAFDIKNTNKKDKLFFIGELVEGDTDYVEYNASYISVYNCD